MSTIVVQAVEPSLVSNDIVVRGKIGTKDFALYYSNYDSSPGNPGTLQHADLTLSSLQEQFDYINKYIQLALLSPKQISSKFNFTSK